MTFSLKHSFASAKSDGVDSTLVQPSDWNAEHTISAAAGKVLGRNGGSSGAIEELGLSFSSDTTTVDFNVAVGHVGIPTGTTGQRNGSPRAGVIRYNSSLTVFEVFIAAWQTVLTSVSPAITGTATLVNAVFSGVLTLLGLAETYTAPAITAGTLTIDLSLGTVFNVANNANITTFTISNAVGSKVNSFTLFLTSNGSAHTQSWGASVKWASGVAPTLSSTNTKVDVISFVTNDGGTTWFGFVGGLLY